MKVLTLLTYTSLAAHLPQTIASNVCSSGIYAALASLYSYAPAVDYCEKQADKVTVSVSATPVIVISSAPPATITVSADPVTVTVTAGAMVKRRATTSSKSSSSSTTTKKSITTTSGTTKNSITTIPGTTSKTPTTTTPTPSIMTTSKDARASSWSSLVAEAQAIIATFCSCAGYPATTTTTVQPTSVTVTTSTTAVTITSTMTITVQPTPTLGPCGTGCPSGCTCAQTYPDFVYGCYNPSSFYPLDCQSVIDDDGLTGICVTDFGDGYVCLYNVNSGNYDGSACGLPC